MSLARELEATEETLSQLCLLSGLVTEAGQGRCCDQLSVWSLGFCPRLPLPNPRSSSAVKWWIKLLFVRPAAHSSALGMWLSAELQMHPGFFQFNSHLLK